MNKQQLNRDDLRDFLMHSDAVTVDDIETQQIFTPDNKTAYRATPDCIVTIDYDQLAQAAIDWFNMKTKNDTVCDTFDKIHSVLLDSKVNWSCSFNTTDSGRMVSFTIYPRDDT